MKVATVVVLSPKEVLDAVKTASESQVRTAAPKQIGGCRVHINPDGSAVVRFGSDVDEALAMSESGGGNDLRDEDEALDLKFPNAESRC